MTPVEIALNLTKSGDGATQAASELEQANAAAVTLGDAALEAERKQARWNQALEQLSTAGLERLETQLTEVITQTEKAGGSTTALRQRLDDVQSRLAQTGEILKRTAADYRNLGQATEAAAKPTSALAGLLPTLGGAAVAMKLKGMADQALAYAEGIKDASERTGLAIEEVQRLTYAADQNAASFAELETGLKTLAVAMEQQPEKLAEIGVQARNADGSMRPLRAVLGDLSQVIAETEDPTRRTSIAVQFLGRSGQQLIPLMSQGREALRAFGDEAERAGRVLSSTTVRDLEDAKQRLENFQQSTIIGTARVAEFFSPNFWQKDAPIAALALLGMDQAAENLAASFREASPEAFASQVVTATARLDAMKRAAEAARTAALAVFERDQQAADMSAIERANKRIAEEEAAKRTPEQKAEVARAERQAQFDREIYSVDRMPNRENAARARSVLERERDLDLAKIDAEAKAERERLNAEAATRANSEAERGLAARGGELGARAQAGVAVARTTPAASANPALRTALDAADKAAAAAREGGATEAEVARLVEALGELSTLVSQLGGESPALKALGREVSRLKTEMAGLKSRANSKT